MTWEAPSAEELLTRRLAELNRQWRAAARILRSGEGTTSQRYALALKAHGHLDGPGSDREMAGDYAVLRRCSAPAILERGFGADASVELTGTAAELLAKLRRRNRTVVRLVVTDAPLGQWDALDLMVAWHRSTRASCLRKLQSERARCRQIGESESGRRISDEVFEARELAQALDGDLPSIRGKARGTKKR